MGQILSIVQGNNFGTGITIHAVDVKGHEIQDFSLEGSTDIRVWYLFAGKETDVEAWTMEDGKIIIAWPKELTLGSYDIFIEGYFESTAWRNAMKSQFRIVKYNYEAYIPADVIVLNGIYQLSAEMALITRMSGGGGTPSETLPLMDGEASVGEENAYARGDHRHPSDTSKQDVIDDLAAIRSGAAAGASAYQKPSTGIPKTDMAQAVQQSLEKADTALQPTDIIDSLSSASTTSALSANQGKVLNESKQNVIDATHKLPYSYLDNTPTIPSALSDLSDDSTHRVVTDTQISAWDNKANKVLVNNHGTDDTTYSVTPNTLHIWGTVASLTLTLATPTDNTIVNEYMIEFTSGSTATTLSLPSSVEWAESCGSLSVEASKTYQISIVNNIGLWTAIANS